MRRVLFVLPGYCYEWGPYESYTDFNTTANLCQLVQPYETAVIARLGYEEGDYPDKGC